MFLTVLLNSILPHKAMRVISTIKSVKDPVNKMAEQRPSKESMAKLPRVIFVDTNALHSLGSQFEHVHFAELLDLHNYFEFDLLVPEVCWLEFLRQRRMEIDDYAQNIAKQVSFFQKLGLDSKAFDAPAKLLRDFRENVEKHFLQKAESFGMQLLPVPEVDIKRVLRMAVDRVAPFQESGEKGFRDSLILFSCMEAIRQRPDMNALAVTEDKKLTEALARFAPEFETQIEIVPNVIEAVKRILARADAWYRAKMKQEGEEARQLVLQYREQIEERVGEIREFSMFEIPGLSVTDAGNVQKVLSLRFKDVESAAWKDRNEKGGRILFSVKVTLTLLVSRFTWDLFNPKFEIGGGRTIKGFSSAPPEEKQVEKILFGEASFIRKNGTLQLAELRIDKSLPELEDLAKLTRV